MTSRDFAYWLQGFFELTSEKGMTGEQVETVKRHLNMVFKHEIDPSMGAPTAQSALNHLHHPSASVADVLIRC
jgi:hypothetical protein